MSSSSFNATSRDAWQIAHASRTNPPEVAKYKPKTSVIYAKEKATIIKIDPTQPRKRKKTPQRPTIDEDR
jgi:hypothetical protein